MSVPKRTKRVAATPSSTGNRLLDKLPSGTRQLIARAARLRSYAMEEQLIAPGAAVRGLIFPTTLVCSVLVGLSSGQRAEMGTVGNEGFVGIPALLGTRPTEFVIAQRAGEAYEISAIRIASLIERSRLLQQGLLQYVGHAYHVAKQTTACNAYHTIEQRLARWLLLMQDRTGKDSFPMTQELLSQMVAATRPRVTEAAAKLRADSIIDYHRGRVTIRDRKALQVRACECYEATRHPADGPDRLQ
jgi:CRP-like cAMP-binding protein